MLSNSSKEANIKWLGATAIVTVGAIAAATAAWYVVQNDRQMKQRKRARAGYRDALKLLQQIKRDQEAIQKDLDAIHVAVSDPSVDDIKKKTEYPLAHCNELLLRLLERLDAIRPSDAVLPPSLDLQNQQEPTEFELELMQHIKERKRRIIQSIERDFSRVDQYKQEILEMTRSP
ncbi:hypothetical protein BDB00DRAFT_791864 [Zychaea mexicana]|uniref:uncharacterized protein n=1 Tax=Zychaea mexicana TaxID=64656 RepID=UPI0022FF3282|nr:uncharacterized protein BDB00DRAFT_791864 [Zychaea mexicana]KAI9488434.1 hypothetical protein BDB00DRAFT_791864 [Zychaea mexicana]